MKTAALIWEGVPATPLQGQRALYTLSEPIGNFDLVFLSSTPPANKVAGFGASFKGESVIVVNFDDHQIGGELYGTTSHEAWLVSRGYHLEVNEAWPVSRAGHRIEETPEGYSLEVTP